MNIPPLKRTKDKVAIVGMAQTNRHLAPFEDPEFEVWRLNESYHPKNTNPDKEPYFKRWDRWFQMHPAWDYSRSNNFNDANHWAWLRNEPDNCGVCRGTGVVGNDKCKEWHCVDGMYVPDRDTDFPIYMLEYDSDVPGSVKYPFEEIVEDFGVNSSNVRYFTNSFGYQVALAILMGFEEIHVFGYEFASESEYAGQRPNAEYWMGLAIGRGIKFVRPENSSILGANEKLYGYEKIPGVSRMHLEIYRNNAKMQVEKAKMLLDQIRGKRAQIEAQLNNYHGGSKTKRKRMMEEFSRAGEEEINALIRLNGHYGYQQALDHIETMTAGLERVLKTR